MALSGFSTSNYLALAAAISSGTPITLAAWLNTHSAAGQNVIALNAATSANSIGLGIGGSGNPVGAYIQAAGVTSSANTSTGYALNQWFHACAVFSSSTLRAAFLNGGSKAINTTSGTPSSLIRTSVGVYRGPLPFDAFLGRMAEVAIWNAALTDQEVASLAQGFTPDQVRPQSLIGYLPFVRNVQDMIGTAWTTVGSLTVSDHPRIYS